jgi:hypothetical protein
VFLAQSDGDSSGEAEGLLHEPMAGVRGRNVAAVHGRDRVPLRRHLAVGQGRPRVQPAAGGGTRRRQGPRGLRRVLRRNALSHAAHRRGAELRRLRVAVAHRHQAGAGATPLDGERFDACILH